MRVVLASCAVLLFGLTSGCYSHQKSRPTAPLFSGKLEGGTFWKNSLANDSGNEGGGYAQGSRVEVYDQFVVVTTPNGLSFVHPHGFYSGLAIRKD